MNFQRRFFLMNNNRKTGERVPEATHSHVCSRCDFALFLRTRIEHRYQTLDCYRDCYLSSALPLNVINNLRERICIQGENENERRFRGFQGTVRSNSGVDRFTHVGRTRFAYGRV